MSVASLLAVLAGTAPAGASTSSGTAGYRQYLNLTIYSPVPQGSRYIELRVSRHTGGSLSSPGTVDAVTLEYGRMIDFVSSPCCSGTESLFAKQTLAATAMVADPVGNSVSLDVTLIDTQQQAHAFSLEISRPKYSNVDNEGLPNAYADPSGAVAASGDFTYGIERYGYGVRGIAADRPFSASGPCQSPCDSAYANFSSGLAGRELNVTSP